MVSKILDFMVACAFFMVTIIFLTMIIFNYSAPLKSQSESSEFASEIYRIEGILTKSMLPYYDRYKGEIFEGLLDESKIENLYYSNYSEIKNKIGIKGDFRINISPAVSNWHFSNFKYRKMIVVDVSDVNVSVCMSFPRGHAHADSLRLVNFSGNLIPFELKNSTYWDDNKTWLKTCTLEFSTGDGRYLFLYYNGSATHPANSTLNLSVSNASVVVGIEERYLSFGVYGAKYSGKEKAVDERLITLRESPRIAYINGSNIEYSILNELGYKVDFYTDRNISDLVDHIFLFDAVIVGSEAGRNLLINSNLSRKEVFDYVNLGGSLLIFGQNIGGYGWMRNFGIVEWNVSGLNQTVHNFSLKILRSPNDLGLVYLSNDSIYLSSSYGNSSYTFYSVPKVINRTLYSKIEKITVNRTRINESLIKNGDFDSNADFWDFTNTSPYIEGDWELPGHIYVDLSTSNKEGEGIWVQTFEYTNTTLINEANLSFCYNVSVWNSPGSSNILSVNLTLPNGTDAKIWEESIASTTGEWVCITKDVSKEFSEIGNYKIKLISHLSTSNAPSEVKVQWDNISLNVSYNPTIWLEGNIGEGRVSITGDEPTYSGHKKLIENMVEWGLPKKSIYAYKMVVEVW